MSTDFENIDDDSEYEYEMDQSSQDEEDDDASLHGSSGSCGHHYDKKPPSNDDTVNDNASSLILEEIDSMSLHGDEDIREQDEGDDYEYEYSENDSGSEEEIVTDHSDYYHGTSASLPSCPKKSTAIAANPNEPPSKTRCWRTQQYPTDITTSPVTTGDLIFSVWGSSPAAARDENHKTVSAFSLIPIMEQRINDTMEALNIPTAAAVALLCDMEWNCQRVLEAFMDDPDRLLCKAGVDRRCSIFVELKSDGEGEDEDCPICMESLSGLRSMSMPCGHKFCVECWRDFLHNTISLEGANSMLASCPDASCRERLSYEEVEKVAPELLEKYKDFQLRHFAASFGHSCPGPGCNRVVSKGILSESLSRTADCSECGTIFCMECKEEPHAPVTCAILRKWREKDKDESMNVQWMTVNTKNCPKCHTRIEKNGGCQFIHCQKCKHGFCWVCMGTHHVWQCNAYKPKEDEENEKFNAKNELERYIHYHTRFLGHNNAQKFAIKQLLDKSSSTHGDDQSKQKVSDSDLSDFMKDANRQLVECRRVLKYTYTFAFFHFADRKLKKMQECFESHQGTLEGLTEGLSMATEKPFDEIDRQDVVNRTRAIGAFIKNVLAYVAEVTMDSDLPDSD